MAESSTSSSLGHKPGPGPTISLVAAAASAYLVTWLLVLLAGAVLLMLPPLRDAVPPDSAEGAFVALQVAFMVAVVWIGMRRERLHGGLAFLTVASLYAGISVGLVFLYAVSGGVVVLGALLVMAGWCWIYGSHGTPWYDPEPTTEDSTSAE